MTACVFCDIAAGNAPAQVVKEWPDAIAFTPLGGVVTKRGEHVLVIPRKHTPSATDNPKLAALAMERAAELGASYRPCNYLTSDGEAATQTVFHLHIHIVPREHGDGIRLPWPARGGK